MVDRRFSACFFNKYDRWFNIDWPNEKKTRVNLVKSNFVCWELKMQTRFGWKSSMHSIRSDKTSIVDVDRHSVVWMKNQTSIFIKRQRETKSLIVDHWTRSFVVRGDSIAVELCSVFLFDVAWWGKNTRKTVFRVRQTKNVGGFLLEIENGNEMKCLGKMVVSISDRWGKPSSFERRIDLSLVDVNNLGFIRRGTKNFDERKRFLYLICSNRINENQSDVIIRRR